MTGCSDEEPGNRIRLRGIDLSDGLAADFTSVIVLPRRAGEVMADDRSLRIAKLCVGCLQFPAVCAASEFAGINLRAGGVRDKDYVFICRRLDLVRHRRTRNVLPAQRRGHTD